MGILKLNKNPEKCIAGASIFSGRPDPIWDVSASLLEKLKGIWEALEVFTGEPPIAPPLGYRGCFLKCLPDKEWFAYGGVVTLKTRKKAEIRIDRARIFEKTLLASAPQGTLPEIKL